MLSSPQEGREREKHLRPAIPLSWFNKGGPGALALEEHPTQTIVKMINFGWDVCKYEAKGHFAIVNAFTESIGEYAKREKYVVKGVGCS